VPYVMDRYKKCLNMNLPALVIQQPTPVSGEQGELLFQAGNGQYLDQNITGTPFLLRLYNSTERRVTIYYNGPYGVPYRLSTEIPLRNDSWMTDPTYPLIRAKPSASPSQISYAYLPKSYSNELTLVKNKKKDIGSQQVMDSQEVFKDWITAWYDSSNINLYDKSGKKFCTVPWSNYEQRASGYCTEPKFFGFRIINKYTYDTSEYETPLEGSYDYAMVQVQYDPNARHACCEDCSCGELSEPQLFCNSCNNCTTKPGTFWGYSCEKRQ
jgi:hypothetical protein